MREGTISVICGVHSPLHALVVIAAWIKLYRRIPRLWEIGCIFLHDVGHVGKDYLSDEEQKKAHWMLGANIAYVLYGRKGFDLIAGHTGSSGLPKSALYWADKYSWYIAPKWWCWTHYVVEPKLRAGSRSYWEQTKEFKRMVEDSIDSGAWHGTHSFYARRQAAAESEHNGG